MNDGIFVLKKYGRVVITLKDDGQTRYDKKPFSQSDRACLQFRQPLLSKRAHFECGFGCVGKDLPCTEL